MNANDIIEKLRQAIEGLLAHAGIADAAPEDIDAEDHQRESFARRVLRETDPAALKSSLPAETVSEAKVERAARKLCEMDGVDPDYLCHTDEQPVDSRYRGDQLAWRAWEKEARAALEAAALAHADDGWREIESAPKQPVEVSVQSCWHRGQQHGPVILLGFAGSGFEQWETQVGWWQPHGDSCWRFLEDDGACDVQPTHWRPLPAPPVGGR